MFEGHIHVHTEYSMLDGMARIEELIIKAKEMGQSGIAITDHGSSSGLYEAWKLGKKYDFNVCLGEEFYIEPPSEELKTGHLILIAKNETGLANIFHLQKLAYDNMYYKPRINLDMLEEYHNGLLCTTACIANPIGQLILRDENILALNYLNELKKIFGDDLYVELQSSTSEDVIKVNKVLADFIESYDYKCIVTSDVHYLNKEDYKTHEVLLAMQQKAKMSSKKRWRFEHNDYWLKSEQEMLQDLKEIPDSIVERCMGGIAEVLEKCKGVEFQLEDHLPRVYASEQEEQKALKRLVTNGWIHKILPRGEGTDTFSNDLMKELNVIAQTGYSGYFLVVQEYAKWAREHGIQVGDGRGSGAGSKVAYTIDITDVNPETYDLLFERFLSPGRQPDFDIDFSDIDAVFKHLQDVYGEDNVARVGAFTRFTAKSAMQKVLSAFEFSQKQIRELTALMPDELSFTFEEALQRNQKLNKFFEEHDELRDIIFKFEGIIEHMSTHAGGVIICNDLTYMLPIMVRAEDKEKMIIALDKRDLEELGHYKFDILGLSYLTVMKNITDFVDIDWASVNYEDSNVYEMLQKGNVTGVFQLSDQRDKVVEQCPVCFEDLIAINALIRPGVCDWRTYLSARRTDEKNELSSLPFMKNTHGLIVYQDQYLQLAQHYAGWDIAYSDKHIRKNKHILQDDLLKEKWLKDSEGREDIWDEITKVVAGGYGFNRAHSTSYARLSYQTAYCKYYYPEAFYAAYLTQYIDKPDKINVAVSELKEQNIKLLHPDVNLSEDRFIPTNEGILMPLNSIKSVGGSALYAIAQIKPIQSFQDFMDRRIKKFVKANALEMLIKSGAFDFDNPNRYELLCQWKDTYEYQPNYMYEFEAFGFYLNETPFDKYNIKPWENTIEGHTGITIGQITDIVIRQDKRGDDMAFATLINNIDTIKLIIFSSVWKKIEITEGDIVFCRGKKDKTNMLVNTVEVLHDD